MGEENQFTLQSWILFNTRLRGNRSGPPWWINSNVSDKLSKIIGQFKLDKVIVTYAIEEVLLLYIEKEPCLKCPFDVIAKTTACLKT